MRGHFTLQTTHRYRVHRRQIIRQQAPGIPFIAGNEDLARVRAKVESRGFEVVDGHAVAINADERVFLWQALGEALPGFATVATTEDPQFAFRRAAKFRALQRHDKDSFRRARVNRERKAKVRRQPGGDFLPGLPRIGGAINAAMVLA